MICLNILVWVFKVYLFIFLAVLAKIPELGFQPQC
jgi:hypothetical protein